MEFYVITLNTDKKRVNHVNEMKTILPELKILDAIDGKSIRSNFLNFLKQKKALSNTIIKNYTKGTIGCYLSHMKMWTTIRHNKHLNTVIFEDDFTVNNKFKSKVNKVLSELPEDYDICYFFYHPFSEKYYKNFNKFDIYNKQYIRLQVPTWGLVGYMVSLKGAEKLIELCKKMEGPVDNMVSRLILLGKLKAFHSKIKLVDTIGSCLYKDKSLIKLDSNTNKGGFF